MEFENIIFSKKDGVATIRLNRPKLFNALDLKLGGELVAALEDCGDDANIRAVVVTGEGKAFCSGGDIQYFKSFLGDDLSSPFRQVIKFLNLAVINIRRMRKPVIAAINGAVGGAGMSLAVACDLRIAVASARFRQAYTGIGMVGDGGWTLLVPLLAGYGKAMELLLLDPVFDAQQAMSWGLVTQVVGDGELEKASMDLASRLAHGPTKAFGIAKENMNRSMMAVLETQLELERSGMIAASRTSDYLEGLKAFTEKRKPEFTGR